MLNPQYQIKNPAYIGQNIRSCGMMIPDQPTDAPMVTIIDLLRDQHYKLGITEDYIMERESMAIVLSTCLEENVFSAIQTNQHRTPTLLESIHENFPIIANHVVDNPTLSGFLEAKFSEVVVQIASALYPAVRDLIDNGYEPASLERFNVNRELSYYVLFGERHGS